MSEQKLVPVESTSAMDIAGAEVMHGDFNRNDAECVWRAMVSAAPIPEQVAQDSAALAWKCALDSAAFYVAGHCADGEHHAETILEMPMPKLTIRSGDVAQVAQEVTQQAAKAETAEQANVLPPTRGTDSQHNADPYDVIEFALELAENKGNQDAMDFLAAWWWETNDDFLRVHWPDFAKLELASRCRAQGGNTNTESSGLAPTTSTVSASGADGSAA